MRDSLRFGSLAILLLVAVGAVAAPVSMDDWFKGPRLQDVSVSPDGRYLSLVLLDGEQGYVAVRDRTGADVPKPIFATDPKQGIEPRFCGWVGEKRLVCRFSGHTGRRGAGEWVSRLVAFDADGTNRRDLLSSGPSLSSNKYSDSLSVAAWRGDETDTLLLQGMFPDSNDRAVGQLNADTGILRLVAKPTAKVSLFQADGFGRVLFGAGVPDSFSREKKVVLYSRKNNDEDWKPLARLAARSADANIRLLPVVPETMTAFAVMTHQGHAALFKVDLTDQKDPELIFWHDARDIDTGIYGARSRLLGVNFESSLLGPQYLDPRAASIDKALQKNFPDRWNWIESASDDEKVLVIRTSSASEASGYYVLDTSKGAVKFEAVGSAWPGLSKAGLPTTSGFGVKTRSGRMKEALFTPAVGAAGKVPLVVFTDGTQKTGGFEPATYFLATRGYAVLRAYFTGTDLDSDWWHRPYLNWNGSEFDELVDAVHWAMQRPDVDPDRICIVGRNAYGGYQALLAATRTEIPLKCAASLEGLSDLAKPRRDVAKANTLGEYKPTGPSDEQVARESPLARATEFHVPILLIEGDTATHSLRDNENGREMAAALAAANKPHQLLLIKELDEPYTRAAYAALEKFLAESLH